MKLLGELHDPLKLITEGEGADKKHYLKGLFLEFDAKNRNGRIYRSEFHDPSVKTWMESKMKENRGWGELDHPEGATINLKNVSHRIVEMYKDGTNWMGKSLICNTPMGQIALGLLESGGTLGSSSRGVGSVKDIDEGLLEVQRDYRIITPSDIVSDPSAHGALMAGIMENVEYFYDEKHGTLVAETARQLRQEVNKLSSAQITEKQVQMMENFIQKIRYNK
jgi:Prohead core protein serine protease